MNKLENYITGKWITGDGDGQILHNAVTGEEIVLATTEGLDFFSILDYGRRIGNPALRKMSFHERGRMLKALALYLNEKKEKFYPVSYKTGATQADSWIDIEGGFGNLFSNASLRRKFPDLPYCTAHFKACDEKVANIRVVPEAPAVCWSACKKEVARERLHSGVVRFPRH